MAGALHLPFQMRAAGIEPSPVWSRSATLTNFITIQLNMSARHWNYSGTTNANFRVILSLASKIHFKGVLPLCARQTRNDPGFPCTWGLCEPSHHSDKDVICSFRGASDPSVMRRFSWLCADRFRFFFLRGSQGTGTIYSHGIVDKGSLIMLWFFSPDLELNPCHSSMANPSFWHVKWTVLSRKLDSGL